jgi:hypothetical protein
MQLVLASNNQGKLGELQYLFAPLGVQLIAQGTLGVPESPEPFRTFVENALAKARNAAHHTGLPALAFALALDRDGIRREFEIHEHQVFAAIGDDLPCFALPLDAWLITCILHRQGLRCAVAPTQVGNYRVEILHFRRQRKLLQAALEKMQPDFARLHAVEQFGVRYAADVGEIVFALHAAVTALAEIGLARARLGQRSIDVAKIEVALEPRVTGA